jgi:hypothetical protein
MAELKIKKLGKAGFKVCIGTDSDGGTWYFMPDEIKAFVDANFKEGDIVTITSKKTAKGTDMLTHITKAGMSGSEPIQSPPAGSVATDKPKWNPKPTGSGFQGKSPADNAVIVRQSVGHMTSRVLAGMMTSGIITVDQVEEQMDRIYKKFQQLVG